MAGFYKEFMAALHAGLETRRQPGILIFWIKERRFSMFCLVKFNINK